MNKESKIGFLETVEKGQTVRSFTRLSSLIMLVVSIWYLVYSVVSYYGTIGTMIELMPNNPMLENTVITLTQTLDVVDLGLLTLLMLSWIAPKAIAKYAENKLK